MSLVFGVVGRKFNPNALTVALCCLMNISKFAKPLAVLEADISSLLSVSMVSELLVGLPHKGQILRCPASLLKSRDLFSRQRRIGS